MNVRLVAIAHPDGVFIERLLDAGLRVIAIHPNEVAATRSRFGAAAASPTGSTPSCCASWHGPTTIASGR